MAGSSWNRVQWQINRILGKYDMIVLAHTNYTEWNALLTKYGAYNRLNGVWHMGADVVMLAKRERKTYPDTAIAVILFAEDYTNHPEWDVKFYLLEHVYRADFFYLKTS